MEKPPWPPLEEKAERVADPLDQWREHLRRVANRPREIWRAVEEQRDRRLNPWLYQDPNKVRGRREKKGCLMDVNTGEVRCTHPNSEPWEDCRQWWCIHATAMRLRILRRLASRDAPGRKR